MLLVKQRICALLWGLIRSLNGAIVDKEASAATAAQTDLIAGKWYQKVPYRRIITGAGLTGSAAVGDFAADLFVGSRRVASLLNTATGAPTNARDASVPLAEVVQANEDLHLYVTDPSATNVGYWILTWV